MSAAISSLYSVDAIARRRIGIFGGSFNPAHAGHLAVSDEAFKRLQLDQIWWLVSPQNPLKGTRDTVDLATRIDHAQRLQTDPRVVVTGLEAALDTHTTAQTFRKLEPMFAHGRFVWIMGADSFAELHKWHDWQTIPETLPFAVFARPGWSQRALSSPAARRLANYRLPTRSSGQLAGLAAPAWCFMNLPLNHESSTNIRQNKK